MWPHAAMLGCEAERERHVEGLERLPEVGRRDTGFGDRGQLREMELLNIHLAHPHYRDPEEQVLGSARWVLASNPVLNVMTQHTWHTVLAQAIASRIKRCHRSRISRRLSGIGSSA